MNRVIRKFSCIGCAILGVAATGLIISSSTSALTEESEVDVKFTFNPMLTLSVSSADIIIPNLIPGTSDNSNTVAITVNTNNVGGYTLSATVGNTSNSSRNLVHTALNTNLFSSIDTSSNITTFTTDNTWGYSIDDGAHYSGLPIYTDTPKEIKSTTEAGNSYTNFLIGAKAANTQVSGDYTNVINFFAVANRVPITWEMAYTNAGKTKTNGYYSIQDSNSSICSEVETGETATVRDVRDNELYTIGKLKDGKCWLLDNLRLDLVAHKNDINSANTNATDEELAYLRGISTGTTSDRYATSGVAYWTSSYSYSDPLIAIKDGDDVDGTGWNPNTKAPETYGSGSGKMGVFYNYCAASAGSYCYGNGTSPGTSSGNSTADICPFGWRMPTGGEIDLSVKPNLGEYAILYDSYDNNRNDFRVALSTPISGFFNNGRSINAGNYGYFHASTRFSDSSMKQLAAGDDVIDTIDAGYADFRRNGASVRCLVK